MKKVNLLSKAEMKNVKGGNPPAGCTQGGLCRFTVTYPGGGTGTTSIMMMTGSAGANSQCLYWLSNYDIIRCQYDCDCDGWDN